MLSVLITSFFNVMHSSNIIICLDMLTNSSKRGQQGRHPQWKKGNQTCEVLTDNLQSIFLRSCILLIKHDEVDETSMPQKLFNNIFNTVVCRIFTLLSLDFAVFGIFQCTYDISRFYVRQFTPNNIEIDLDLEKQPSYRNPSKYHKLTYFSDIICYV